MTPERRATVAREIIKLANEARLLGFEHDFSSESDEHLLVSWARALKHGERYWPKGRAPTIGQVRTFVLTERSSAKLTGSDAAYGTALANLYERVADLLEPPLVADAAARKSEEA